MTVKALMPAGLAMGIGRHDLAGRGKIVIQPRASAVFENGSACVHRDGVQLAEVPLSATPRTDLVTLGRYEGDATFTASSTADSAGGALNSDGTKQSITLTPISEMGTGWFATGTGANLITEANLDQPCFWYDDDTLYLTDLSGTLSYAGHVAAIDPTTGRVAVKSGELWRSLYLLFSAGETAGATVTADGAARLVATNIPAGAFAAGAWTATATGAFPTNDGIASPLKVGDVLVFPPGTITTQVVAVADSGPYEATVIGATGVKAVFTRPAWFAHGAVIKPHTTVKVGGEGTTYKNTPWVAKPATAAKVVGTDDPGMFPAEMVVAVTCASGTATVSTIPLRAAGLFFAAVEFTGGSPAATTTGLQLSTQTPGGIGTASLVIQEQAHLGTLVNTGSATGNLIVRQ